MKAILTGWNRDMANGKPHFYRMRLIFLLLIKPFIVIPIVYEKIYFAVCFFRFCYDWLYS